MCVYIYIYIYLPTFDSSKHNHTVATSRGSTCMQSLPRAYSGDRPTSTFEGPKLQGLDSCLGF